jgi:hypothetical protein
LGQLQTQLYDVAMWRDAMAFLEGPIEMTDAQADELSKPFQPQRTGEIFN